MTWKLFLIAVILSLPACYSLDAQRRDLKEGRVEPGRQTLEAFLQVWGEPNNHAVRVVDTYEPFGSDPLWFGSYPRHWSYGYHFGYHSHLRYARYQLRLEELYYDERNVILTFQNDRLVGYRPIRYLEPMELGAMDYTFR